MSISTRQAPSLRFLIISLDVDYCILLKRFVNSCSREPKATTPVLLQESADSCSVGRTCLRHEYFNKTSTKIALPDNFIGCRLLYSVETICEQLQPRAQGNHASFVAGIG